MKPTYEELEQKLEESRREFRSADATIHNLELKITDLAVQLANAESKCRELAAENSGLKNSDFYIALRTESDADILNDKHLTICYMSASATSKLDVNRIMPEQAEAKISAVEYWERVNLTVALIDSPDAHAAHKLSKIAGFTYDLEFMPHVTLGCGDTTKEHQNLVGKILTIGSPYIRIKESKRKTPDTDAFLAEVRAQGVEMMAAEADQLMNEFGDDSYKVMVTSDLQRFANAFAAQLRKGAAL
ncbi:hypothetical protein ACNEVU_001019 [Escherichia coli]|uniref:hypothetical protein n=1 Tax=Escherichia coli TaxID=562 RepID=UPI000A5247F7|nr:hypothetical protein [Escherichia coli]EMC1808337.1 hypothetical protein [Escherichia coli]NJX04930.1 hypothetical protein [Escherichia coli]HCN0076759.1 hypothetical protein [Escherichia coli]